MQIVKKYKVLANFKNAKDMLGQEKQIQKKKKKKIEERKKERIP